MKKLLLIPATLFLIGCTQNPSINVKEKMTKTKKDMKLLKEYHTTKLNLHKLGDNYVFLNLNSNGNVTLYTIDKNYDLLASKKINLVITPQKLKVLNNKIYVLAYSQTKNLPTVLILDKNGDILKQYFIGNKYNTPKDFIIENNDIIAVVNTYSKNNATDIAIYKNKKPYLFSTKYAEEASYILPFQNGYLLIGNVNQTTQNVFVAYLDKNFKTMWVRDIDFGIEESVKDVKIVNNEIILNINSQNYTGMEEYYTVKIDKNGKILNHSKEFEIKNYPLKFQG